MNKLFDSFPITKEGIDRIKQSKEIFTRLMTDIAALDPEGGREFDIMKQKLEEANFYLNKSISLNNKDLKNG